MSAPLVSVVIPCYNGESFIAAAIESALAQTESRLEVIVVDDGSTDGSNAVVESIADERVRLIRHPGNRGISAARNTGIRAARAPYIALLDQDDHWRKDKLAAQLPVLEADAAGEIGMAYANIDVEDLDTGTRVRHARPVPDGVNGFTRDEIVAALFLDNFIPSVTVIIPRRCLDEVGLFDESITSGGDDFELFIRLALRYRLHYTDAALAVRREHGDNFTDPERMVPDALRVLDGVVERHPELRRIRSRSRGMLLLALGRDRHVRGNRPDARAAYREALAADPSNRKARVALLLSYLGPIGDRLIDAYRALNSGDARQRGGRRGGAA